MSLYDVILKELDLNEGDEFTFANNAFMDNYPRKFVNGKMYVKYFNRSEFVLSEIWFNNFLGEDFKITITKRAPWVPKVGEKYYIPTPERTILWDGTRYDADDYDLLMIKRGMAFKTQKEAEDCAKKMLDAIKGD